MKVGDVMKDDTVQLLAEFRDYELGRLRMNHPRCGKVVIKRDEVGLWRVAECERPDAEEVTR